MLADAIHGASRRLEPVAGGLDPLLTHLGGDHAGVPSGTEFFRNQWCKVTEIGFEFYSEIRH